MTHSPLDSGEEDPVDVAELVDAQASSSQVKMI